MQQLHIPSMEGTPDLDEIQEEFYEDFEKLSNPLKVFSTEYKRNEYFRQKGILLLPEEKLLGHSLVPRVHRGTGTATQEQHRDTFQYIPIGKVLSAYLQQPGVMKSLLHQPESRDLSSFRDGYIYNETWKGNKEKPVIPLLIYVDDFETANPLGSRKGVHKLFAVYFSVLGIPQEVQARLEHIHLLALANSRVLSAYGVESLFRVVVEDLNKLHSNGLLVECEDFQGLVYPKLFQLIGDNLAVNPLLGYSAGFNANCYCRSSKASIVFILTMFVMLSL